MYSLFYPHTGCSRKDMSSPMKKESVSRKGKKKVGESSNPIPEKLVVGSPESKHGSYSKDEKKKEDDNVRLFNNFEIRTRIVPGIKGHGILFRNRMHLEYHKLLMSRSHEP